jgi:hypothetical protein
MLWMCLGQPGWDSPAVYRLLGLDLYRQVSPPHHSTWTFAWPPRHYPYDNFLACFSDLAGVSISWLYLTGWDSSSATARTRESFCLLAFLSPGRLHWGLILSAARCQKDQPSRRQCQKGQPSSRRFQKGEPSIRPQPSRKLLPQRPAVSLAVYLQLRQPSSSPLSARSLKGQ